MQLCIEIENFQFRLNGQHSVINPQNACTCKLNCSEFSFTSKHVFRLLTSASRCSSVSMGWHRTTCLLCATLHPDSLDARIFALRIADSSTFHVLHCRRAVFEPSRMLVHLCGTLPVHLKNRNLTLTTFMRHLKSYLFSQY